MILSLPRFYSVMSAARGGPVSQQRDGAVDEILALRFFIRSQHWFKSSLLLV
jgi:hypothetical protein